MWLAEKSCWLSVFLANLWSHHCQLNSGFGIGQYKSVPKVPALFPKTLHLAQPASWHFLWEFMVLFLLMCTKFCNNEQAILFSFTHNTHVYCFKAVGDIWPLQKTDFSYTYYRDCFWVVRFVCLFFSLEGGRSSKCHFLS